MKILIVLTSHSQLGNTGHKTGFWIEGFAAPYYILKDAGAALTLASPKGGQPPLILKVPNPLTKQKQRTALIRIKTYRGYWPTQKNYAMYLLMVLMPYFIPAAMAPCGILPLMQDQYTLLKHSGKARSL